MAEWSKALFGECQDRLIAGSILTDFSVFAFIFSMFYSILVAPECSIRRKQPSADNRGGGGVPPA